MNIPILRIPFVEADQQFIYAAIDDVLQSGNLTMGKYTAQLEERFAEFAGSRYCVAVNSGTAALEVIIRSLGIEGQSIIVPTNTFLATAFAVVHSGNRVIFADSRPDTLCLDVEDVRRWITKDTRAVILVHIGGIIPPQVQELVELCKEHGLYLIEDCAHAHGCSLDGRGAGTFGIAGGFSLFPTKVLTTGEGGTITTDDEEVYRRACIIRNQGKDPSQRNRMTEVGHNFRMSEFTALVGVQQMNKAHDLVQDRRRVACFYDDALSQLPGIRPVRLPDGLRSTYYKYIAYLDETYDRSAVKDLMREKYGVSLTGEVYADLCHTEPVWQTHTYCGRRRANGAVACCGWPDCDCGTSQTGFAGAEYISHHHVCLPLYPGLTDAELDYIVESLASTLVELGGK